MNIERQILPDGGHVDRDPGAIIEILLELLPLRQAFASRNIAPPQALLNAIDRDDADAALLPPFRGTLRAFQRHGGDAGRSLLTLLGLMTRPAAPRCRMRRIPAISAWKPAAPC